MQILHDVSFGSHPPGLPIVVGLLSHAICLANFVFYVIYTGRNRCSFPYRNGGAVPDDALAETGGLA